MNGTLKDNDREDPQVVDVEDDDLEESVDPEHTIVMDTDDDEVDVSDITGELNIEELVAKLDATDADNAERRRVIKARLDELADRKMTEEELGSTYTFDLDDD